MTRKNFWIYKKIFFSFVFLTFPRKENLCLRKKTSFFNYWKIIGFGRIYIKPLIDAYLQKFAKLKILLFFFSKNYRVFRKCLAFPEILISLSSNVLHRIQNLNGSFKKPTHVRLAQTCPKRKLNFPLTSITYETN